MSVAVSVITLLVSSEVVISCALATGKSLTGVTVIVIVAILLSTIPSLTLNAKESVPL